MHDYNPLLLMLFLKNYDMDNESLTIRLHKGLGQQIQGSNRDATTGKQAANRENKRQPEVSGETGLFYITVHQILRIRSEYLWIITTTIDITRH